MSCCISSTTLSGRESGLPVKCISRAPIVLQWHMKWGLRYNKQPVAHQTALFPMWPFRRLRWRLLLLQNIIGLMLYQFNPPVFEVGEINFLIQIRSLCNEESIPDNSLVACSITGNIFLISCFRLPGKRAIICSPCIVDGIVFSCSTTSTVGCPA